MSDRLQIAIVALALIFWALSARLAYPEELQWYQERDFADPIDHWEFRYTFDYQSWYTPLLNDLPSPCIGCYRVDVVVPDEGAFFQLRAISVGGRISDWSNGRVVPEPGVGLGLAVGALALSTFRKGRK